MLRIAICEDDKMVCSKLANSLRTNLQPVGGCLVDEFYDGEQLVYEYEKQKEYDIIVLDIEMPLMNGLEAGKLIRQVDEDVDIIIHTNYKKYALLGYDIQPYMYLLKPFDEQKLVELCIQINEKRLKKHKGYLSVEIPGSFLHIPYSNIVFLESIGKKAYINQIKRTASVYMKLSEIYPLLDKRFVCTHKSFIINLDYVDDIDFMTGNILLNGYDTPIPISRRRKKEVLGNLKEYVCGN